MLPIPEGPRPMSTEPSKLPPISDELTELYAIGDLAFEVMQTIVDGECKNKALGHCETILKHVKELEKLLNK